MTADFFDADSDAEIELVTRRKPSSRGLLLRFLGSSSAVGKVEQSLGFSASNPYLFSKHLRF